MSDTGTGGAVVTEPPPLVQLVFDVEPGGQAEPRLAVRWCLTDALIEECKRRYFSKKPYLLLTIRVREDRQTDFGTVTGYRDLSHRVVRVTDELTYLTFTRPGPQEVIATVIDPNNIEERARKVLRWIKNPGSAEEGSLFTADGTPRSDEFQHNGGPLPYIAARCVETVDVDERHFAKEPPKWALWFVGQFFHTPANDPCHFRQRFGLSVLYAIIALTIGMVLRVGVMIGLLIAGMRHIDPRWLRPFDFVSTPLHSYRRHSSIWIHNQYGDSQGWWRWILNPPVLLGLPLLVWAVAHSRLVWWQAFVFADLALVAFVLVAYLLLFVGAWAINAWQHYFGRDQNASQPEPEDDRYAELRAMVCDTPGQLVARPDALPHHKRTVWLRFAGFKASVCQPYARRR